MNIFPVITKEKQKIYEQIHINNKKLKNNVPCICGYYGRACRNMNSLASSRLCDHCTLSLFASTVEAILECCNEKEKIGIQHLYNSDIYDIQELLKSKTIKVNCSYIDTILDSLETM